MQSSVPETLELDRENEKTKAEYGMDRPETRVFGEQCLAARRLVERGVRFVQVFHGGGGGGAWDAHSEIKGNHTQLSAQVDKPMAGLLKDLKRRGLLESTIVVCGTEFGRSPGAEGTGRDHHPHGFSAWLAGGGIKGGIAHGATDEWGSTLSRIATTSPTSTPRCCTASASDSHRLQVPGRKRLEIDHGKPIEQISVLIGNNRRAAGQGTCVRRTRGRRPYSEGL